MRILDERVERYLHELRPQRDDVMRDMEALAERDSVEQDEMKLREEFALEKQPLDRQGSAPAVAPDRAVHHSFESGPRADGPDQADDARSAVAPGHVVESDHPQRAPGRRKCHVLPVVARLVVEIRSDGRHTIARGAAEDASGERVQIEAQGSTPLQLAFALVRSLANVPAIARRVAKGFLPARKQ